MAEKTEWDLAHYVVKNGDNEPFCIAVKGRIRWALVALIAAGEKGCTPIDTPGPRWSDYVFKLRGEGVEIETVHEAHGGPFSGRHARYVLRSRVSQSQRRAAA